LPPNATEEQLRDAYFRRAKELHPDVAGPGHEVEFQQAQSAYEAAKAAIRTPGAQSTSQGNAYKYASGRDHFRGGTWHDEGAKPYGTDYVSSDASTQRRARAISAAVVFGFVVFMAELFSASCGPRFVYKPWWRSGSFGTSYFRRVSTDESQPDDDKPRKTRAVADLKSSPKHYAEHSTVPRLHGTVETSAPNFGAPKRANKLPARGTDSRAAAPGQGHHFGRPEYGTTSVRPDFGTDAAPGSEGQSAGPKFKHLEARQTQRRAKNVKAEQPALGMPLIFFGLRWAAGGAIIGGLLGPPGACCGFMICFATAVIPPLLEDDKESEPRDST
jgi:hypothetical protein